MQTLIKVLFCLVILAWGGIFVAENCSGDSSSKSSQKTALKAVPIFNKVDELRNTLSDIGIGSVRPWRRDAVGWLASSDYFEIGKAGSKGLKNNLAYYLDSEQEHQVNTVKLKLNINNLAERELALAAFAEISQITLNHLGLLIPPPIKEALEAGRERKYEEDRFMVTITTDNDPQLPSWRFVVESK